MPENNEHFKRSIWWIKRDMRLLDNEALVEAIESSSNVLPVFIFEDILLKSPETSVFHVNAWIQGLKELRKNLQQIGGDMWVAIGNVEDVFSEIYKIYPFEAVFSHMETGSDVTYQRDFQMKKYFENKNIAWIEMYQNSVRRRLKNISKRERHWREYVTKDILQKPTLIPLEKNILEIAQSKIIPNISALGFRGEGKKMQKVDEENAQRLLNSFLYKRSKNYIKEISSPNTAIQHGSRLSPHLAWGTISLRTVYKATQNRIQELSNYEKNNYWIFCLKAFISRLHWHDHFVQRLELNPQMEFETLHSGFSEIPYKDREEILNKWLQGQTGFPIVDACMRCLQTTGFINFRMRALIVSFACFVLHLSWKSINAPLAQLFADYEPGIHICQIQMQAGVVGINSIRVYSPKKQAMDQDPECNFIKKWIPELRDYKVSEIHNYDKFTFKTYPQPIVDYESSSKQMKKIIFSIKNSKISKEESQVIQEKYGSKWRPRSKSKSKKLKKEDNQTKLFET